MIALTFQSLAVSIPSYMLYMEHAYHDKKQIPILSIFNFALNFVVVVVADFCIKFRWKFGKQLKMEMAIEPTLLINNIELSRTK